MIVHFSRPSDADMENIGAYIRMDNPARAESFELELRQFCIGLAILPRAYPLVPRFESHGLRRAIHGSYLIFYRVTEDLIEIVRIIHGARDYDKILFGAE